MNIKKIIKQINSKNSKKRLIAARALYGSDDPAATEQMIRAASDTHMLVKEAGLKAFMNSGCPQKTELLIKALGDYERNVRIFAAEALANISTPECFEPCIKALADPTTAVRAAAVTALGRIGDLRAADYAANMLDDTDITVRQRAVFALVEMNAPSAFGLLKRALEDDSHLMREAAAEALGSLGDTRAVGVLLRALGDCHYYFLGPDKTGFEGYKVRRAAAAALGRLGEAAWELIVRGEAEDIERLRQTKDVRLADAFMDVLCDRRGERDQAKAMYEAIPGELRSPRCLYFWLEYNRMKADAATALGELKEPRAVEPLVSLYKCGSDFLRYSAVRALGMFDSLRAEEVLKTALKDSYEPVRAEAAKALGIDTDEVTEPKQEDIIRKYLHRLALDWWDSQPESRDCATCDACGATVERGKGFLIGSWLWCESCYTDPSPDMLAPGTLEQAMAMFGKR